MAPSSASIAATARCRRAFRGAEAAAALALAAGLPAACTLPQEESAFEETGELIALSGGDAGAHGACVICHGLAGEGDGELVPRLAGLDPGYAVRQLELFSGGQRRHPQMVWIADQLSWDARQKVADHFAALPVPALEPAWPPDEAACAPATARLYHLGDPSRGLQACATCHGAAGEGVGQGNPPLADQPAPYLAHQLKAWRTGQRYGDARGVMTHVSRLLSDAEVTALAGYSSVLRGASAYPAPPAACL